MYRQLPALSPVAHLRVHRRVHCREKCTPRRDKTRRHEPGNARWNATAHGDGAALRARRTCGEQVRYGGESHYPARAADKISRPRCRGERTASVHEMSIVSGILESVTEVARRAGASRLCQVNLRIGVMREVVPEAMDLAWEVLCEEDPLTDGCKLTWRTCIPRACATRAASDSPTTASTCAAPCAGAPIRASPTVASSISSPSRSSIPTSPSNRNGAASPSPTGGHHPVQPAATVKEYDRCPPRPLPSKAPS